MAMRHFTRRMTQILCRHAVVMPKLSVSKYVCQMSNAHLMNMLHYCPLPAALVHAFLLGRRVTSWRSALSIVEQCLKMDKSYSTVATQQEHNHDAD